MNKFVIGKIRDKVNCLLALFFDKKMLIVLSFDIKDHCYRLMNSQMCHTCKFTKNNIKSWTTLELSFKTVESIVIGILVVNKVVFKNLVINKVALVVSLFVY